MSPPPRQSSGTRGRAVGCMPVKIAPANVNVEFSATPDCMGAAWGRAARHGNERVASARLVVVLHLPSANACVPVILAWAALFFCTTIAFCRLRAYRNLFAVVVPLLCFSFHMLCFGYFHVTVSIGDSTDHTRCYVMRNALFAGSSRALLQGRACAQYSRRVTNVTS